MLQRTLSATVRRAMETFPAVVVTGARQAGKTTLLRAEFGATHRYASLENPDVRSRAVADPVGFLRENPPPVVLDEIQHVPSLFPYIKTAIDEDRRPGRWLLSGSQAFSLMAGVTESLAGRAAVLGLLPLSVGEATAHPGGGLSVDDLIAATFRDVEGHEPGAAAPSLADWILRGAWPEPRANPRVDRKLWCAGYVQTYLERDVRALAQVADLGAFERFLRLCVSTR